MFLLQKPEQEVCVRRPFVHSLSSHYQNSVAAPAGGQEAQTSVPATKPEPFEFTAAISAITSAGKVYTESRLPPVPPTSFKRWRPEISPDPPHDPAAYFPMYLVK